jgi:hypothetical protein
MQGWVRSWFGSALPAQITHSRCETRRFLSCGRDEGFSSEAPQGEIRAQGMMGCPHGAESVIVVTGLV